jgi:hypothetical protein
LLWRERGDIAGLGARTGASPVTVSGADRRLITTRRGASSTVAATAALEAASTRREATEWVRALYRKEQVTRELDLEQRRYGRNYWQSECNGRELAILQQTRETLLKQLSAEATQLLNDLFPGEAGEPIALVAIFAPDRPGPNLTFLSASARERFEARILSADGVREHLIEIATQVLRPEEMESYHQWNDRAVAALRNQLVGFDQTEGEFGAILLETRLVAEDGEASGTGPTLERQLGAARYADLLRIKDPPMHTALQDLQRLGLPLAEAEWLAATRTRAIAEMDEIWKNAALTDVTKRERVLQLERIHGQTIAAKLALPDATLDGLDPSS